MTASAVDLVENPNLDIDPIAEIAKKGYSTDELAHFKIKHDDLEKLIITIYNFGDKGRAVKKNLRPFITDATFEDSIDATPTFTMIVHDPDWDLLNTGALDHIIDVNPGNIPRRWYRITGINVSDDDITLTFSTRNAVYLSYHKKPVKANRKRMTRAQFIKFRLLRSVKKTRIRFYCPQLDDKQKIAKRRYGTQTERKHNRQKGFSDSDKLTVKNNPASQPQRDVIEQVIAAGQDVHSPGLVTVSAVMCVIQESAASNNPQPPNPPYVGAFQQNRAMGWPATGNAYKDAKGYYNAAIPRFKKNPNVDLGELVAHVQGVVGSTNPLNFGYAGSTNRWRAEAQHAVNAYSGAEVGDLSTSIEFKKKYEFMVGPDDGALNENYLAALYRLAEEVHWSAYWVRDVLHYMSEEDLFKAKARTRLRRGEDGVEHISFNWDRGKKINDMLLSVRMDRWVCPVGTVVVFDEGGPAQGRWLVTNIRRSMFNELGEITLSKPSREKLEIANESGSKDAGANGSGSGAYQGNLGSGGNLEDIKVGWTPKQIIDRLIPPKAKAHHMTTGLSPAMIQAANAQHGGTQSSTWHKGNGALQYAVDLSNATTVPDAYKDDLASELIMAFDMPDLANPQAIPLDRYVPGNIVNAYHKGYHFQLIYRTYLNPGGNHYNHVHFGVKREGPPRPG